MELKNLALAVVLTAGALGLAYTKGHSDATDSITIKHQAELLAANRQLEVERAQAQETIAAISKEWQGYLGSSKASADRVVADLRGRNIGLSVQLADATVRCVTGDGRPLPDGRAELRDDFASALIEQAQRADTQVRGLQKTIRALQGGK